MPVDGLFNSLRASLADRIKAVSKAEEGHTEHSSRKCCANTDELAVYTLQYYVTVDLHAYLRHPSITTLGRSPCRAAKGSELCLVTTHSQTLPGFGSEF